MDLWRSKTLARFCKINNFSYYLQWFWLYFYWQVDSGLDESLTEYVEQTVPICRATKIQADSEKKMDISATVYQSLGLI